MKPFSRAKYTQEASIHKVKWENFINKVSHLAIIRTSLFNTLRHSNARAIQLPLTWQFEGGMTICITAPSKVLK